MAIVGLTGGIGSGKSTASRRFEYHGIPVIDADRIGHGLIGPGGRAVSAVVETFGSDILSCGIIDREKLGKCVFGDGAMLERLNAIVHPLIAEEIASRSAAEAASGRAVCLVDAALLGEGSALEPQLDALILVLCDTEVRIGRLVAQRGMTESQARQRIAAQVDPARKQSLARWVIDNSGDLPALHHQVDRVAAELLRSGWSL